MLYGKILAENLLRTFRLYVEATGVSPSSASLRTAGDNTFFRRVEAGENFTVHSYDRVMVAFSAMWPSGVPWPSEVPRPPADTVIPRRRQRIKKEAA